ncbi:hypothetical protein [Flavobacterium sp. ASW18X]|uniref:hypothetical protein n=1 Tax=Flavobacterium sp. ASW18X TaxID=2572595 RepID=UPI00146EBAD8|nr:hypothetical protein [Flavobacterium sp. ASW18X]
MVLISINLLFLTSWSIFSQSVANTYVVLTSGTTYKALVIGTEYSHTNGDNERRYAPIVEFTTENGERIKRKLNHSESEISVGDTYTINYNEETDMVITMGFTLVITLVGSFIFVLIFSVLFYAQIHLVLGKDVGVLKELLSKVGFNFLIPFLMIAFDALLIYALFYGNRISLFGIIILLFFILILTLAIVGYISNILNKGRPTLRRTGLGRWSGGWEN